MAVPALLGIPALLGGIGTLLNTVVTFFIVMQIKKVAVVVASMSLIYYATMTLFEFAEEKLIGLLTGLPSGLTGFGYILPANTSECLSIIFACQTACLTYTLIFKAVRVQLALAN